MILGKLSLERFLKGPNSSANYEPLPKFDPKSIEDLFLQLKSGLNFLRENHGCKNDILKFRYIDSRYIENENQLQNPKILMMVFGVVTMRGMFLRRKGPLLRILLKVRIFISLFIPFLSLIFLPLSNWTILPLLVL